MMMGIWWFVIIIIILITLIFILFTDGIPTFHKEENPLSILNKRYANGQIDDEEYIRRKNLLKKKKL